jgi:hypothetical protein
MQANLLDQSSLAAQDTPIEVELVGFVCGAAGGAKYNVVGQSSISMQEICLLMCRLHYSAGAVCEIKLRKQRMSANHETMLIQETSSLLLKVCLVLASMPTKSSIPPVVPRALTFGDIAS